ncbi:MAG: hypothetical protein NT127_04630 [Sphingobacteriales bacterium]|nr:hypothetical protein [Sphingobacteriales bacterium]
MKKTILLGLMALLFSASYFLLSCQHTIPVGADCENLDFQITATSTNATSGNSNGTITVTASGGDGFYYNLNGGSNNSSGVYANLAAGNYTVIGHNSAGCSDTAQVTVGTTNPCTGINITINTVQTQPTAGQSNGSITANATPAGSYTYSINGGAFQTTGVFNNLIAGSYTIVAKNSTGCTGTTTITLVDNNPCTGVNISISTTQTSPTTGQSNGSITATASPAGTYTYSINGGTYQSSGIFNNLSAANYTITAKNAGGCTGSTVVVLAAANPCTGITIGITPTVTNVVPCGNPAANGSIAVVANGSSGFTYNSNGGAYQASSTFSGLTAGNYTIGVKDLNGCTKTQSIVVGTAVKGPKFTNVKNIIIANCGSCHLNGGNTAGYNFDNECSIVNYWSQIKGSCVQPYTLRQMPPSGALSTTLQAQITAWVNAGHKYTD